MTDNNQHGHKRRNEEPAWRRGGRIRGLLYGVTALAVATYGCLMHLATTTTMVHDGGSVAEPPSSTGGGRVVDGTTTIGGDSRHPTRPRTLVVVTGSLRGGEVAWRSLYENVLDVHGADLAVLTEDAVPARYENASLFRRARYVWWVPKRRHFNEALDEMMATAVSQNPSSSSSSSRNRSRSPDGGAGTGASSRTNMNTTMLPPPSWRNGLFRIHEETARRCDNTALGGLELPSHGNESVRASGAIIYHMRWVLANKIRELRLTDEYDRFVVTRSDQYYACPLDMDLYAGDAATPTRRSSSSLRKQRHRRYLPPSAPSWLRRMAGDMDDSEDAADSDKDGNDNDDDNADDVLWVPGGEDHRGICDRHFVATGRDVLAALDVLAPVLAWPDAYLDVLTAKVYNSEQLLRRRWEEEGLLARVRRHPRTMFLCAHPDDSTRWRRAGAGENSGHGTSPAADGPGRCLVKYPAEHRTAVDTCRRYRETGTFRRPSPAWTERLWGTIFRPRIEKCPFATPQGGRRE